MTTAFINVARHLELGSAIDIPWSWLKDRQLTDSSVVFPQFSLSEDTLKQTAARAVFASALPAIAKLVGAINLGLGAAHFLWCVCNIKEFRASDDKIKEGRQEFEKALVRMATGAYDLGIGYLLNCSLLTTVIGKATIPTALAFFPTYTIQAHHLIFEKADDHHLQPSCLIQRLAQGFVDMGIPEPKPTVSRFFAFPVAMGSYVSLNYTKLTTWWNPPK